MQHNYTSSNLDLTKAAFELLWFASDDVFNAYFGNYGEKNGRVNAGSHYIYVALHQI